MTPTREQILVMAERLEIDAHDAADAFIDLGLTACEAAAMLRALAQAEPNADGTRDKATIAELEAILNNPNPPKVLIRPDGQIDVEPAASAEPVAWLEYSHIDNKLLDAVLERDEPHYRYEPLYRAAPSDLAAGRDEARALYEQMRSDYLDEETRARKLEIERDAALAECALISESAASAARASAEALRQTGEEIERLRSNLVDYLLPMYLTDRSKTAALCDEQLDRSGALLGMLRDAAAKEQMK